MKMSRGKSFARSVKQNYVGFDQFGAPVSLKVNGDTELKTCTGATVSLLLSVIVLYYAFTKSLVLVNYGDTKH